MTSSGYQNINGYVFPADLDVPESSGWTRVKRGSGHFYVIHRDLLLGLAHQRGVESIETDVVAHGRASDDVAYSAVKTTVKLDGCPPVSSIGSTDQTTNDLEDMVSTAETRATKRAIKAALNIRNPGEPVEDEDAERYERENDSGGSVEVDEDGDVTVNPPDDYKNDEDGDFGF